MEINRTVEFGLLVLLSFLWGGSFTLVAVAVESIPPATIVAVRVSVAAIVLLSIARARGIPVPSLGWIWGAFAVQGFLQSALPFTLISWGQMHIDSAIAGLLNSTPPLFVFLITFLALRREGSAIRKFVGVAVGLTGVALVVGAEISTGIEANTLAAFAVTLASVSYALAALYGKRFSETPHIVTAGCAMAMAALAMVPIAIVSDRPWTLQPGGEAIAAVAALAFFSTALAMMIYFRLLKTLGALATTSGSYLRAGFSVALGVGLLGEPLTASLALGFVLILAGVAIMNQIRSHPRP